MIDGKNILYFMWIVAALCIILFIPRNKVRLAWVAFLFNQFLTWPLGLCVVDMGWIEYPITFFEKATHTSFTFEFFIYPVISSLFNIYFPEGKSFWRRSAYYVLFCSTITIFELFILHYTELIRYIHWNAYFSWITLFITFYLCHKFCLWFFKPYSNSSNY